MSKIFKCVKSNTIVEVLSKDSEELTCGGNKMIELRENTEDAATEKHVPVVEKNGETVLVKVGSVEHPMEEAHYIQWIEVLCEDEVYRKYLNPGDKPEAEFTIKSEIKSVREYCNLHGLWKYE